MKKSFIWVIVLFLPFLCFACNKPQNEMVEKSMAIYAEDGSLQKELNFDSLEQVLQCKMEASGDWRMISRPEWLVVNPQKGNAETRSISFSAEANLRREPRKGMVEFSMENEVVLQMKVSQNGRNEEEGPDIGLAKKADLLDLVFSADGAAEDVSPLKMPVKYYPSLTQMNYYNCDFNRNVAQFLHDGGNVKEGYFRVDYRGNDQFLNKLRDGHSMEMVFSCAKAPTGEKEIKMFSTHESGGTGFLISKAQYGNCITFLPNVSESGRAHWVWTRSGITPEPGKYYHVVGVWDQAQKKSFIYVNGRLCGEADAPGEMILPKTEDAYWIGIGTDAGPTGGQGSLDGEMVLARIFDEPLTASDVELLYDEVRKGVEAERIQLGKVEYLAACTVPCRYWYHLFGEGFKEGDKLAFVSGTGEKIECEGRTRKGEIAVQIPDSMKSGRYDMLLIRGGKQCPVGPVDMKIRKEGSSLVRTQCVAHRCYHQNGSSDKTWPENSLAALKRTQELGCWGCEIDVHITKDDVVLVNHNSTYPTDPQKRRIDNSNFSDLKDVRLSNGESVPTLQSFLEQLKKDKYLHLVIEIKTESNAENTRRLVDKCMDMVKAEKLLDRVAWIAFDYVSCQRIASALPDAMVMYLGGNLAPSKCHEDGIMGVDYDGTKMTDAWIEEAHKLGMKVNVWTINAAAAMSGFIAREVDYITTDHPEVLQGILSRQFVTAD